MMDTTPDEGPNPGAVAPAKAPSPQSEAVANELQELSLQPAPNLLPIKERKNGELWVTSPLSYPIPLSLFWHILSTWFPQSH